MSGRSPGCRRRRQCCIRLHLRLGRRAEGCGGRRPQTRCRGRGRGRGCSGQAVKRRSAQCQRACIHGRGDHAQASPCSDHGCPCLRVHLGRGRPSRRLLWCGPCRRSDRDQHRNRRAGDHECHALTWSGPSLREGNLLLPCAACCAGRQQTTSPRHQRERNLSLSSPRQYLFTSAATLIIAMTYLSQLSPWCRLWFRWLYQCGQ